VAELTHSINSSDTFADSDSIVARLKEGDEAAFSEVFQLYKDLVYTLACKILVDKSESMDTVQEVFLTLHRKISSFRGDCSLKTWIYRIAVNQAANRNRWWKRRFQNRTVTLGLNRSNGEYRALELPDPAPSPARECFSSEFQRNLQEGLRELPFEQRVAVVLRDAQGLSYEEITEVTGAQVGTVKSRIARGREKLRKRLRPFRGGMSQ
jgi:RNA polymerase sigma-70 factor (ECF subfamily)